jgi:HlyD family secretion protein
MDTNVPGVSRNIVKKKKATKFIIIGIVALLVIGGVYTFITIKKGKAEANTQQQRTAQVTKGDISISITGSAAIASSNRVEFTPNVAGSVKKVNFKQGDTIKAGDVLFELDDSDAKLNVENTKNSIAQEEVSQSNNVKSLNGLIVKAPYSGQVTKIQVKPGDTMGKNGAILTLTDTSRLKVTIPFSGSGISGVKVGKKVTVNLQDLMQSVDGTISYVSSKPYTSATGGELYNVEIMIDNPGSLKVGMKANAEIVTGSGVLSSVDVGTLAYVNNTVLKSDAGGTVKNVKVMENQFVNAGDVLMELQNDDLQLTLDTQDLKIKGLQAQLETAQNQLTYYKIVAPFDGTIITQDIKAGDNVKPATVLAILADMGHMEFSVPIDELDIAKIQVGQRVDITVDALPDTSTKPLTGQVTKTAMEGTSQGGVTTYPVTISINETDKLKAGMNANAEIFISEKKGVLMVPLEAVQKMGNRSLVWVKGIKQGTGNSGLTQGSGNGANAAGNRRSFNRAGAGAQSGNQASGAQNNNAAQGAQNGNAAQNAQSGNTQQGAQSGNAQLRTAAQNARRALAVNPYYANAGIVPVETGINNDTYIEVISGLKEGDTVILPPATASSGQSTTQNENAGFGGMGMMGRITTGGGGGGNGGGNNRVQQYQRGD